MRDRPTGADLLAIARRVLREELLPLLPEEKRYDGLMVANAIAIAARQMAAGDGPAAEERARLAALLGAEGDMAGLAAELARRIRRGDYDPGRPGRQDVRAFLWKATVGKLRESNPKALAAEGIE
jgi:hypothetical protein